MRTWTTVVLNGLVVLLAVGVASACQAAEGYGGVLPEEKDMLLTSLPSGVVVIPDNDETPSSILSLSRGAFEQNPYHVEGAGPESEEELFNRLETEGIGDVFYEDAS